MNAFSHTKFVVSVFGVLAVSGCQSATTNGYSVEANFSDGFGIVRGAGSTADGDVSLAAITPDAASFEGVSIDTTAVVNIDPDSFSITGSDANGSFYTATAYSGNETLSITGYITDNLDGQVMYAVADDGTSALVGGGTLGTNIPVIGSSTYRGSYVVGERYGTFAEIGSFTMAVDFQNDSAGIQANSDSTALFGTGLTLNSNGEIFGDNLTLTVDGRSYDASLYGNAHGDGATAVSGVFHDNSSNPDYGGAFAGQ